MLLCRSIFCCIWISGFCFSSLFLLDLILVNLSWNSEFMLCFIFVRFLKSQTQIYLMWYLMKLNSLIRLCLNFKIESIGFFFFWHQFICLDSKQGIIHVMFSAELIWFLCYEDLFCFLFCYSNRHLRRKRILLCPRSQPNLTEESRRRRFDNVFGFRIWFFQFKLCMVVQIIDCRNR